MYEEIFKSIVHLYFITIWIRKNRAYTHSKCSFRNKPGKYISIIMVHYSSLLKIEPIFNQILSIQRTCFQNFHLVNCLKLVTRTQFWIHRRTQFSETKVGNFNNFTLMETQVVFFKVFGKLELKRKIELCNYLMSWLPYISFWPTKHKWTFFAYSVWLLSITCLNVCEKICVIRNPWLEKMPN